MTAHFSRPVKGCRERPCLPPARLIAAVITAILIDGRVANREPYCPHNILEHGHGHLRPERALAKEVSWQTYDFLADEHAVVAHPARPGPERTCARPDGALVMAGTTRNTSLIALKSFAEMTRQGRGACLSHGTEANHSSPRHVRLFATAEQLDPRRLPDARPRGALLSLLLRQRRLGLTLPCLTARL